MIVKELNPSRVNFGIFHILVALRDAGLLHKVAVTPLAHYATGVLCKANTAVFLKINFPPICCHCCCSVLAT